MAGIASPRAEFLAALRRERTERAPWWVMRQAGRYLPEYRALRERHAFLDMVRDPALAAEVTLQPVRRFAPDAAVIFSDILVPCAAMGVGVSFEEGSGPALAPPVRTAGDVERLQPFDPAVATRFLGEALRRVRAELGDERALIGFCGAPWTVASYLIEGGSSRNFERSKALLYGEPAVFARLCERLVDALVPYLAYQVESGADALQIFDSWGGALDAATYREHVLPHVRRLVHETRSRARAPIILYVNGAAHLLKVMEASGADALGLDWRVDPQHAIDHVGFRCALQGNLDPCALLAAPDVVEREARRVLAAFREQRGYVFNLGSGILPQTPLASMEALARACTEPGSTANRS